MIYVIFQVEGTIAGRMLSLRYALTATRATRCLYDTFRWKAASRLDPIPECGVLPLELSLVAGLL